MIFSPNQGTRRITHFIFQHWTTIMRWAPKCVAGIALVGLFSTAQAQVLDWRTFVVPDFGTTVQYPASIFAPAGKPERGMGQRFERADGRAV
jgi:hypothetical protein